jgi:hypothetical protein
MKIAYSKYLISFTLLASTVSLANDYTIQVQNPNLYNVYYITGTPNDACSNGVSITSPYGSVNGTWKVGASQTLCPFWASMTLKITDALSNATLGTLDLKGYPWEPPTLEIDNQNLTNAVTVTSPNNTTIKLTFTANNGSKRNQK